MICPTKFSSQCPSSNFAQYDSGENTYQALTSVMVNVSQENQLYSSQLKNYEKNNEAFQVSESSISEESDATIYVSKNQQYEPENIYKSRPTAQYDSLPNTNENRLRHYSTSSGSSGISSNPTIEPTRTPRSLAEALHNIGLSQYLECLEAQEIDLRVFLTLTEEDLQEVGVELQEARQKMGSYLETLRGTSSMPVVGPRVTNQIIHHPEYIQYELHRVMSVSRSALDEVMIALDRLFDCHREASHANPSNTQCLLVWLHKLERHARRIQQVAFAARQRV